MTTPSSIHYSFPRKGIIKRNPLAGQTGLTTVATDVRCTDVFPANARNWLANFGTGIIGKEAYLLSDADIQNDDILIVLSKKYTIRLCNSWPPVNRNALPRHHLYLEERH